MPNDHPKGSRKQALSKRRDPLFLILKNKKDMIWSDLYGNVKLSFRFHEGRRFINLIEFNY